MGSDECKDCAELTRAVQKVSDMHDDIKEIKVSVQELVRHNGNQDVSIAKLETQMNMRSLVGSIVAATLAAVLAFFGVR